MPTRRWTSSSAPCRRAKSCNILRSTPAARASAGSRPPRQSAATYARAGVPRSVSVIAIRALVMAPGQLGELVLLDDDQVAVVALRHDIDRRDLMTWADEEALEAGAHAL